MDLITRTILGYTAEVVGVNPDQIISNIKTREFVLARSIFADIAYSEYMYSYSRIGRIINRDHATVMHNIEVLNNQMWQLPSIKHLRKEVFNRTKEFLQHPHESM
jgi:chromosomal replication initiation ATPase DnaA